MTQAQFDKRMDSFVDNVVTAAERRGENMTREHATRLVKEQMWRELIANATRNLRIFGRR